MDGLQLKVTTRPYSRLVDLFCQEYRTAFVHARERETRSGLRRCLALNGAAGAALHARLGPSREHVALLCDEGGSVAAGMNFICFPIREPEHVMTVHTTYVFVAPAWRGRGLLRRAYDIIERMARDYAAASSLRDGAAVIFVGEQKDPFRMTPDAFRADAEIAGQSVFARLGMWGSLGARVLGFPYVQPPLTVGGAPDRTLFLRIVFRTGRDLTSLDPRVLAAHLRRFFGISVAKGRYDPMGLPEVAEQLAWLARQAVVTTQPMPEKAALEDWQRQALKLPRDDPRTIGMLLGVPSLNG